MIAEALFDVLINHVGPQLRTSNEMERTQANTRILGAAFNEASAAKKDNFHSAWTSGAAPCGYT